MSAKSSPATDAAFKVTKVDKSDATTRAAREIVARATAERDAKTARLRALRLAKEAEDRVVAEQEVAAAPAAPAKRKRAAAKPARAAS